MLHRKIYQLCCDGREVWIFLRDQQRWIERAKILDIEGDLVTLRYETEEEDESCSWEEVRSQNLERLFPSGSLLGSMDGFVFLAPSRVNDANEDKRFGAAIMNKLSSIGRNINCIALCHRSCFSINVHFSTSAKNVINFRDSDGMGN